MTESEPTTANFIWDAIEQDLKSGRYDRVHTRFPHRSPTAICTSGTPRASTSSSAPPSGFGGLCNLRFDDTNPVKEEAEYVEAQKRTSTGWATTGRPGVLCLRLL